MTPDQQAELRRGYVRAGNAVQALLNVNRAQVGQLLQSINANEDVRQAWARNIAQWERNYMEARRIWMQERLSDGEPSWDARMEAARLMKITANQMLQSLRILRANVQTVPAALRIANQMGLADHIAALSTVMEGGATVVREVANVGKGVLAFVALLLVLAVSKR